MRSPYVDSTTTVSACGGSSGGAQQRVVPRPRSPLKSTRCSRRSRPRPSPSRGCGPRARSVAPRAGGQLDVPPVVDRGEQSASARSTSWCRRAGGPGSCLEKPAALAYLASSSCRCALSRSTMAASSAVSRVHEHRPAEAVPDQPRQVADVVEVRVREQHVVEVGRVDGERVPVAPPVHGEPLVEAGVDQDAGSPAPRAGTGCRSRCRPRRGTSALGCGELRLRTDAPPGITAASSSSTGSSLGRRHGSRAGPTCRTAGAVGPPATSRLGRSDPVSQTRTQSTYMCCGSRSSLIWSGSRSRRRSGSGSGTGAACETPLASSGRSPGRRCGTRAGAGSTPPRTRGSPSTSRRSCSARNDAGFGDPARRVDTRAGRRSGA